jgi:hypothetical protein
VLADHDARTVDGVGAGQDRGELADDGVTLAVEGGVGGPGRDRSGGVWTWPAGTTTPSSSRSRVTRYAISLDRNPPPLPCTAIEPGVGPPARGIGVAPGDDCSTTAVLMATGYGEPSRMACTGRVVATNSLPGLTGGVTGLV